MYPELFQYLLLYKKLPVPGVGTICLERSPARIDFPNKQILPPAYAFTIQEPAPVPGGRFFRWLGSALGISQMDAVIRYNDFAFDLKKHLEKGHTIHWAGLGSIRKEPGEGVRLLPDTGQVKDLPVRAEKVLREKAAHTVLVGETEKTSAEMEVLLSKTEEKKNYWWVWALGLGLLALTFTAWYFSEKGLDCSSTANTIKLKPAAADPGSYRQLP